MNLCQKKRKNSCLIKVKSRLLKKIFRNIIRFSTWFKVVTVVCLCALLLAYLCPFVSPSTFWLLPFFGLAYPIIFLLSLLLLVFWTLAWSKWAWVVLTIILVGSNLHLRMIALGSDPNELPRHGDVFHVMSYNVRLFDFYNWKKEDEHSNRNQIFDYVQAENPDLICFQEFYHQDKPTIFSTRDTLREILQIKDYHERYSQKLSGRQNYGIAMLSKYPMICKGDVVFSDEEDDDDNYCIYADIVKNQDTFRVYNVHLQSIKFKQDDYAVFGEKNKHADFKKSNIRMMLDKLQIAFPKRAAQAHLVVQHIESSPYPIILCGDFNDTPLSYTYQQFNKKLKDAYRNCSWGIGATYAGKIPAGRIDYLFHSKELQSAQFKIQEGIFSDHRAISCWIYKK
jgi:endonuclease/exonuclease/phosphatase family metal-dependent hydrolase